MSEVFQECMWYKLSRIRSMFDGFPTSLLLDNQTLLPHVIDHFSYMYLSASSSAQWLVVSASIWDGECIFESSDISTTIVYAPTMC
jgi:hypothetical protein